MRFGSPGAQKAGLMDRVWMPRPLVLLLLVFLLLSTLYNRVVPPGEGPDEPAHMAYVLFLARERRLPVQRHPPASDDVPGEGHQPPLAYLLALPAVIWLPPAEMQPVFRANPAFRWSGGAEPAAFMRPSRDYWPWQGVTLAWHLARAVSGLLGAVTVWCVWQVARMVSGQITLLPLLAAALVAFNPQFLFTSALVTNDALLITLSAALIWLCLLPPQPAPRHHPASTIHHPSSTVHGPPSTVYRPFFMGLLFGLALLTKQSALLFGPLLLWASWRMTREWRAFALTAGVCLATALVVAGWWYVRNYALYDDISGLAFFQARFMTQPFDWQSLDAWRTAIAQVHASFWSRFGWMSLLPPPWVSAVYLGIEALALLGMVRLWTLRQSCLHTPTSQPGGWRRLMLSPWAGLVLVLLLTCGWMVSFALTAGLVAWQGRLLFPALLPIAVLLAVGLSFGNQQVLPEPGAAQHGTGKVRSWRQAGLVYGVIGICLLLAIYLPLAVIRPAYAWYTLPPAEAQMRIATPVSARFAKPWERGVELRGWRMEGMPRPGQTITVTLTWHALEAIPRDWMVFVHLVDDQERILAEDNRRPQDGRFRMPLWTPGDWVEDPHPLTLPADLPPGRYELRAGLYEPEQRGERQYIRNPAGEPVSDAVLLGTLCNGCY